MFKSIRHGLSGSMNRKPGTVARPIKNESLERRSKMRLKTITILCLLLFGTISAQNRYDVGTLFGGATDTIGNITKTDTLYYRVWVDGYPGTWHAVENTITAAEKTGETNQEIPFADDDNWTWGEFTEFKIVCDGGTTGTETFVTGWMRGAVTGILVPSVSGSTVTYTLKIGGN